MVKGKVHTTCDEDLSECQPRESECPGHVRVLCILIHTMWQQFSATCQWMPTCTTWHEVPTVCHSIVMPTTWQPFSQRVSGCQEETLPRGISDVYHMTMIAHHVSVAVYHMTGRETTTWQSDTYQVSLASSLMISTTPFFMAMTASNSVRPRRWRLEMSYTPPLLSLCSPWTPAHRKTCSG